MALIETLATAQISGPSVVTIGTFDGVHLGHRHLLQYVARRAHDRGALAVVITFHPRPAEVLRPNNPSLYLCSLEARLALLRQAGADIVVPLAFSRSLSQMSAFDFAQALVDRAHLCELIGGPDLALGRGREGTPAVLREIGTRLGFEVSIVPVLETNGEAVRSSAVRRIIGDGDVARASTLLGRRYRVEGEVVRGDGRGRTIGVPTANVAVSDKIMVPGNGVYAVYFHADGQRWHGAANVGTRPTFDGVGRSLEVHLLGFDGDLYGKRCLVEFVERLRPEQRFANVVDLVRQIHRDIASAREIL